jgi:hypothetical protein
VLADIGLGLSVIAAAAWSGLLLMLTTVLHPMFARQGPRGFAEDMRRFLPIARRSPTNYVLVALLVLAPAVALVGLWGDPTGGAVPADRVRAGGHDRRTAADIPPLRRAELRRHPVLGPEAVPPDWRIARARWLRLNWIRTGLTLLALALFTAAYLRLT